MQYTGSENRCIQWGIRKTSVTANDTDFNMNGTLLFPCQQLLVMKRLTSPETSRSIGDVVSLLYDLLC